MVFLVLRADREPRQYNHVLAETQDVDEESKKRWTFGVELTFPAMLEKIDPGILGIVVRRITSTRGTEQIVRASFDAV